MGIGIDLRTLFQNTYSVNDQGMENIFDFISATIAVAAKEKPKEFLARRSRIIEALLMASPMDDIDQDCSISSSSNFSWESLLDEDLDDQFDGATSAPSKPINLGVKEKGCGVIQSVALNDENKDRSKKFQRRIETEDPKHKIDARSGKEGLSLDEVKFDEVKKKVQIGAKEKGCGIIKSAEENRNRGKKFQRKIKIEDAKHKIDASRGNAGLSLDEVKFDEVKKKVQIGANEKGYGIIKSAEENRNGGKKFQRKIKTEDAKHKIDASSGNKGLSLDEVKFDETNLDIKMVKKKVQIGAKEKGCGIIKSEEENKNRGKKFQRKIETEDAKRKIDARSGNKGLSLDEVKFEATKRKFEETSLDIKNVKRKIQILDFKDIPQSKLPTVDENRFKRGGFKKSSFRRR